MSVVKRKLIINLHACILMMSNRALSCMREITRSVARMNVQVHSDNHFGK